ncbi:MAG: DedA family protein [Candidatus Competibacterales bacterium]|nr:DedA family protein [Candidatus Competibacterales bacterium]
MTTEQLIADYGYWAVLFGTFLEGETVLVLGGLAARLGELQLTWVIAAAFVGTLCGDQLYFFLGRRYGRRWLISRTRWQRRAARLDVLMQRWGILLILVFRFMYGVRTMAVLVFGMSGISVWRFAALNALGALLWASTIASLGFAFGHGLDWLLQASTNQRLIVIGVAAALALGLWLYCARHLPDPPARRGAAGLVAARVAGRRSRSVFDPPLDRSG